MADWVIVAVSDDAEQAREDAKRQIAFHATVRTYDRILDLHGFDATSPRRSGSCGGASTWPG